MAARAPHPHIVILPFPGQGHVKPMLILAELLSRSSLAVTVVNTDHNHRRLVAGGGTDTAGGIDFLSIPDGLPPEHPRIGTSVADLLFSIPKFTKPIFKSLISSMRRPPACVISDAIMSFAIDVAGELGIPAMTFRVCSAAGCWINSHLQHLVEAGDIPVREGSADMDSLLSFKIPGLENVIRRRDLPHICRLSPDNPYLQFEISQTSKSSKASALIINTFEELEAPIIAHLRSIFPAVYAIGPLHASLSSISPNRRCSCSSSLIQTERTCMNWLDSQPSKSVLYISFGSLTELTREQLMEFWHGIINSEKRFLWAIRPDLIIDEDEIPEELKNSTKERGFMAGWVPQEEVLEHEAVGGFLTHCGWNSTIESISAGKSMLGWPCFVDQLVNSRCVEELWNLGIDIKDINDRSTIERMVRNLMEGKQEHITKSTAELARLARDSVREGGSSHRNFMELVQAIRLLHSTKTRE
ncbi:7-deoxyloganetic acid glucosyltransferase-like isoform X2 [Andrographis paniculata]|uniref:7-deoxyloganetic acid glucosyltransferase-like isoform X2 n=1 Tax=Andrographis paniculata TaxID=175694 RepID=UPI0021E91E0D|nr:7-deoxyloganetic acid glucosyltransferase-like isoform X2 [Andrographis paniculata]XP_051130301.1 7-deoxyloganetic acid glucosyltransferase-like isoform X2 [Andrographis paniculata]XP_051130302.1 7-deoxyloganetic acid glucosyltransferase-like isoform X2 [Andrographis paniculata]XP_051130303.1 7-deoxyloganetic acid glucosyltransferase-like isoform X2 [Andrographis paniculata]